MINASRYYTQIIPYIRKFGKEQVLILDFDDLIKNQEQVLQEISDFINIDFKGFFKLNKVHSNPSIKGKKLHYRFNKIVKFLSPVLKRTPEGLKDFIRKIISNPKRIFKEKPKLSKKYKELIIRLTRLDILELNKITGKDYSHWLNPE